MRLDKKAFKMILLLLVLAVLFAWLIINISWVWGIIRKILGILSPFFLGLCIAFVMNIVLRPLERLWLKLRPKKSGKLYGKLMRPVCLTLSLLIIFGIIFAIFFVVIPEFSRTLMSFVNKIPEYAGKIEQWWHQLSEHLAPLAVQLPELELNPEETIAKITGLIANGGMVFLNSTIGFTASVVSGLVNFFVALVFCIYILAQKEIFGSAMKRLAAALFSVERVNSIYGFFGLVNRAFTNYVTGQLTEAVIIGSLCFLGMLLLDMPYAPVISVLVGFTALIPVFGAFIGTAVGAFLILLDSPVKAFWFVVFILVLQQLEGNLIYPRVVGKSVGLPAILVLMAVTVGGSSFGVLGMLLSVPIFSVLYTLVCGAVDRRLREKGLENIR